MALLALWSSQLQADLDSWRIVCKRWVAEYGEDFFGLGILMWCVKRLWAAVLMDEAGVGFIVGSRTTRAPGDLEAHFRWEGDAFTDGQVIDTITPRRVSKSERHKSLKAEPVWAPVTHPAATQTGPARARWPGP